MKFINSNKHIVIDVNGELFILDTGAMRSFMFHGGGKTIIVEGKEIKLGSDTQGAKQNEELEKLVGMKLDGFIALDNITKTGLTVDYKNEVLSFDYNVSKDELNYIDFILERGRIIIPRGITINGKKCNNLILDTGAVISYLIGDYLDEKSKLDEKYKDYAPDFGGNIENNYYAVSICVKNNNSNHIFKLGNAIHADGLDSYLRVQRLSGVVGLDFLSNKGYFIFDFKNNKIWFK